MECTRLLELALQGVKVIESSLARHLALELFSAVKGHASSVGPVDDGREQELAVVARTTDS